LRSLISRVGATTERGEVMPAERAPPGGVAGTLVAGAQRGAVEGTAEGVTENVVVGRGEIFAL
jgi:hypothetical protein